MGEVEKFGEGVRRQREESHKLAECHESLPRPACISYHPHEPLFEKSLHNVLPHLRLLVHLPGDRGQHVAGPPPRGIPHHLLVLGEHSDGRKKRWR